MVVGGLQQVRPAAIKTEQMPMPSFGQPDVSEAPAAGAAGTDANAAGKTRGAAPPASTGDQPK